MSQQNPEVSSSSYWRSYTKAAAVFIATAATYLVARNSGAMDALWRWQPGEGAGGSQPDEGFSNAVGRVTQFADSVVDWSERAWPAVTIEEAGAEIIEVNTAQIKAQQNHAARRLLQTNSSGATVVNLIPDQVIDATLYYQYDIEQMVTGDYDFIKVSLADDSNLPPWLTVRRNALLDAYDTPGFTESVQAVNGLAYAADGASGLQVLNVSNPAAMTLVGAYDTPGYTQAVQVVNGLAYVADGTSGLQVLNVSNPTAITPAGAYDTPGYAQAVEVINSLAYVADRNSGLQILNVSNPTAITLAGTYDTPSSVYGVQVVDSLAYVVGNDMMMDRLSLQILDVSNPAAITLAGTYDTPSSAYGVQVVNGLAYVADYASGLRVLNVSNPAAITQVGAYDTPNTALTVQVINGVAYVSDAEAGLQILDITQWQWRITPALTDIGNYRVTLTATNELGGFSSDSFTLRVEGGPQLNPTMTIAQQYAKVNVPFNYFIPQGLVIDPNNDPISFSASLADGSSLPVWLSFNGISATLAGLAQSSHVGNYSIRIIATDNILGTTNANTTFILYVDHLPYVNQRITDQVAGVGLLYNFTVPAATFIDPDSADVLTYSARQRDGSVLPSWLNFNVSQFVGTPGLSAYGNYRLLVIATDGQGGEAQAEFALVVEHFPSRNLNQSWSIPVAGVGKTWAMTLPPDIFIDADDTQLSYMVQRADGASLPGWLSVNPFSGALLGVPTAADVGATLLRFVVADSYGGTVRQEFTVTVTHFPELVMPVPMQLADVDKPYQLTLDGSSFRDLDGEPLTYRTSLEGGLPLPAWLSFNATSLSWAGIPRSANIGNYRLALSATDPHQATADTVFDLLVEHFPRVQSPIIATPAGIGQPWSLTVSGQSFIDIDDSVLTYRASRDDESVLPTWLSFNPATLVFSSAEVSRLPTDEALLRLRLTAPLILAEAVPGRILMLAWSTSPSWLVVFLNLPPCEYYGHLVLLFLLMHLAIAIAIAVN